MTYLLRHVKLNTGGYDCDGRYWGRGQRLYMWMPREGIDSWRYLRAIDRDDAKQQVRHAVAATDPAPRFWA